MVIIVLLNDEFTCATPETIFLRSRRRTRVVASFAIALGPSSAPVIPGARASWFKRQNHTHPGTSAAKARTHYARLLLLAGDRLRLALAGAGVGVGTLTTHRQLATMTQTAVDAEVGQPLDVHRNFAAQIAFN